VALRNGTVALEIVVLVSAGRHPISGRARRAPADARALEMGMTEAAAHAVGLSVLHAGDPDEPALRDYLGMGVEKLEVIRLPPHADPVPALSESLRALRPALVLTGLQAETGWSSGCIPYALAAALGYAIAPAAAALEVEGDSVALQQALPKGRRRVLRVALPAVVTVSDAAPPARQVAYARARRGKLVVKVPAASNSPSALASACTAPAGDYELRPARARPRRLAAAKGATAAERLQVLTAGAESRARVVRPKAPGEGAREILAFLQARGLQAFVDRERSDEIERTDT
jgi:electron transfer flavoprotein beta subunit